MSKKKRGTKAKALAGIPSWMVKGNLSFVSEKDVVEFKTKKLGTFGAASGVRRIDPVSGRILEDLSALDVAASQVIKDGKKLNAMKGRNPRKARNGNVRNTPAAREAFYLTWDWRTLRMEVLKERGRHCDCCGATPQDKAADGKPVRIQVDHIKPLSKFWHLRLDRSNLQVLCAECNQGKGAWDATDWRQTSDEVAA